MAYLLPASLEGMELLSSTERPNPPLNLFRKRLDALPLLQLPEAFSSISWEVLKTPQHFISPGFLFLAELIPPGISTQGAISIHVDIFQTSRDLSHWDGKGAIPSGMRDPVPLGCVVALQQISHQAEAVIHPQLFLGMTSPSAGPFQESVTPSLGSSLGRVP